MSDPETTNPAETTETASAAPTGSEPAPESALTPEQAQEHAEAKRKLRELVIKVLRTVFDPEIPVNIYELGLVYSIDVSADGFVHIRMTLTTPACPVAESLPVEVQAKVRSIVGVRDVQVEIVWEPQWTMNMMSEAARLTLGF